MVLSTSQQVALAFTAVLFTLVVLPRLFGVGGGSGAKESRFDSRYTRKAGPGPGAVRGQPINMNAPGSSQTPENMQQMKKLMEQELKSDKYKSNSNKGYVFTLMPLYAIGVGVFAAYKFLKIKSADDQAQKDKFAKGAKKSVEAENQLNELEQRLAQTERMLNSILTQLDPLTNCVKSVAQEQKNEIMSQLQTIRYLMKKRGMDCPPLNINEASCGRNLDDLIESLGASDTSAVEASLVEKESSAGPSEKVYQKRSEAKDEAATDGEEMKELIPEECDGEAEEEGNVEEEQEDDKNEEGEEEEEEDGLEDSELMPSPEESYETNIEEAGAEQPASGLRRRNRPE
ncbi:coiled-coil domain-containing protein 107 isoform X2 [Chelmon rostratus]|uniref:coiled-coil domain-containing protein 107 isoform X2 n=1 Tax=Chelmon rostratus TaxID=109905 RepID=UPI001BE60084|nr:coiled-coil domain-containing protein 107 isoform X2 [Chelmon rostratus]